MVRILGCITSLPSFGDCRKGRRPSFCQGWKPNFAIEVYKDVIDKLKMSSLKIKTGVFQAMMDVKFVNHGPVTLLDRF